MKKQKRLICLLVSATMTLTACGQHGSSLMSGVSDLLSSGDEFAPPPIFENEKALSQQEKQQIAYSLAFYATANYSQLARLQAFQEFDRTYKAKYGSGFNIAPDIEAQSYRYGVNKGMENSLKVMTGYFGKEPGGVTASGLVGLGRNIYSVVKTGSKGAALGVGVFALEQLNDARKRGQNPFDVREKRYFDDLASKLAMADELRSHAQKAYDQELQKYKETGVKSGRLIYLEELIAHQKGISPQQSIEKNIGAANEAIQNSALSREAKSAQMEMNNKVAQLLKKEGVTNIEFRQGLLTDKDLSFDDFSSEEKIRELTENLQDMEKLDAQAKQELIQQWEIKKIILENTGTVIVAALQASGDGRAANIVSGLVGAGLSFMTGIQGYLTYTGLMAGLALMAGVGALVTFAISLSSKGSGSALREILSQLRLMAQFLEQLHKQMHERFDRIDRNLAEMMKLLVTTFNFQNQILAGLRDNMAEVQQKLNMQIYLLEEVKTKINETYQEVLKNKEMGLYVNLEKEVYEQCILFPQRNPKLTIDKNRCYQQTISIIENSLRSPMDRPVLLTGVDDIYAQFSGQHEDRLRLLPQALASQINVLSQMNINIPNLVHLNTAILLASNFMSSSDEYEGYRQYIIDAIDYTVAEIKKLRDALRNKEVIKRLYNSYAESEELALSRIEQEWMLANQKVLNSFRGSDSAVEGATSGGYQKPAVPTSTCVPVDTSGAIIKGAEAFDYEKDLNNSDVRILNPDYWADVLPDDLKRAIYHRKGELTACLHNSLGRITSELTIHETKTTIPNRHTGDYDILWVRHYNSYSFSIAGEVRFFWKDNASKDQRQILSIWLPDVAGFSQTEMPVDKHFDAHHKVELSGIQKEEIRAPGGYERRKRWIRHYNSPRGRKLFGQYSNKFVKDVAMSSRAYINERLREFFKDENNGIKPIFEDTYSGSQVSELVHQTNRQFLRDLYISNHKTGLPTYALNNLKNKELNAALKEAGFKRGVLETVFNLAFPVTFNQDNQLTAFFSDINGMSSSLSLLSPQSFLQTVVAETKAYEDQEKANPEEQDDSRVASAIYRKISHPTTAEITAFIENFKADEVKRDIHPGIEQVFARIKTLSPEDMRGLAFACILAELTGANMPVICPNEKKNPAYVNTQYFVVDKKELKKVSVPEGQTDSVPDYLENLNKGIKNSELSIAMKMKKTAQQRKEQFMQLLEKDFNSWLKTESDSEPQVSASDWLKAVARDRAEIEKAIENVAKHARPVKKRAGK